MNRRSPRPVALAALSCLIVPGIAGAGIVWDEGFNGDLSGDRLAATALTLHAGVNSLLATSVQGDRE